MRFPIAVAVLTMCAACLSPVETALGLLDAGSNTSNGGAGGSTGGGSGGGGNSDAGGGPAGPCGDCPAGSCTLLATERAQPHALARDSTRLYWLESDGGIDSLVSMPLGGGPVTALATGLTHTMEIAVDSTGVYGTDFFDGCVWKVPLAGGAVDPAFVCASPNTSGPITARDPWVYWSAGSQLIRVANNGSNRTNVSSSRTFGPVPPDGQNLYVSERHNLSSGQLGVITPASLGAITPLTATEAIGHLAANDDELFWVGGFVNANLTRMPKTGGVPQVLVPSLPNQPNGLAVDSTHAFAIVGQIILKVNLSDAGTSLLVDGGSTDQHVSMATDSDSVYFTSLGCGFVAKKSKQQ